MKKLLFSLTLFVMVGGGCEAAHAQTLQPQGGTMVRPARPRLQPNPGEIVRPGPVQPVQISIGEYVADSASDGATLSISALQAWMDTNKRMVGGAIVLAVPGRNGVRNLSLGLSPLASDARSVTFATSSNNQRTYRNFVGLEVVLMPETGAVRYEIRSQGYTIAGGTLVAALPGAAPPTDTINPVKPRKPRLHPQEQTLGKEVEGEFKPKPPKPIQGTFVPLRPPTQPAEPTRDLPPSPGRPNRY